MPTSYPDQISTIIKFIMELNPSSILDIGTGFGKYGFLCREYLELWDGREDYHNFVRRIDGIEAFKEYITPVHHYVYNNIYVGDALTLVNKLDFQYELVLMLDVLEHFTKQEGMFLIESLLINNKGILISTPKHVQKQKDSFHNPFEEHKFEWKKIELSRLGESFFIPDKLNYLLYIGPKNEVKNLKTKYYVQRIKKIMISIPLFGLLNSLRKWLFK